MTSNYDEFKSKFSTNLRFPLPTFAKVAEDLLSELANTLDRNEFLTSATLFQIAYGSSRLAFLLSNAGAAGQVPVTCRHAIEAALYAMLFAKQPMFEELWWEREIDPKAKQKFRDGRNGAMANAWRELETYNPDFRKRLRRTYQHLIDFGAHPNIFQFLNITDFQEVDNIDRHTVSVLVSQKKAKDSLVLSVGTAIEISELYRMIWPARFDLLNGSERLAEVRGQLKVFKNATDEKS